MIAFMGRFLFLLIGGDQAFSFSIKCIVSPLQPLRMIVNIENEILGSGFNSQVVKLSENLGPVVRAVIDHMQQHLPHK